MEYCSSDGKEASRTRSSAKSRRRNCVCTSSIEPELLSVRYWSKSFMKRLNRRGLKLQPCRIPLLHANVSDSSHIFWNILGYVSRKSTFTLRGVGKTFWLGGHSMWNFICSTGYIWNRLKTWEARAPGAPLVPTPMTLKTHRALRTLILLPSHSQNLSYASDDCCCMLVFIDIVCWLLT